MANKETMWSVLLHLGTNMWNEEGNLRGRGENRSNRCASPVLLFNRELWDENILKLIAAGANALIIDVGEALFYESHPELAVKGSFTHDEMRAEVERLKAMGFEVIPKLNFSACHDIWLKEYSWMLSTPIYYQVCKDVIREVAEVFKPKYFHIGMDEETADHQRNFNVAVIRQFDQWWKDFYFLVNEVEKYNARPWIWSDYMWHNEEVFLQKMPKSVIQSNWYYSPEFSGMPAEDFRNVRLRCFDNMDKAGFDQVPTGSTFSSPKNFEGLVRYSMEHISPEHTMGFMHTTWERVAEGWLHHHDTCAENIKEAIKIYK